MMPTKNVMFEGEIYTEKNKSSSLPTTNLEREISSILNPIIAGPSEAQSRLENPIQPPFAKSMQCSQNMVNEEKITNSPLPV